MGYARHLLNMIQGDSDLVMQAAAGNFDHACAIRYERCCPDTL
jgi:hypothetical protein